MKPWRNISIEDFHLDTKPWTWGLIILASLYFILFEFEHGFLEHWNYAVYLALHGLFYLPILLINAFISVFCLGILLYRKSFWARLLAYCIFFVQVFSFISFFLLYFLLFFGLKGSEPPAPIRGNFSIISMVIIALIGAVSLSQLHKSLKTPYRFGIWFWVIIGIVTSFFTYTEVLYTNKEIVPWPETSNTPEVEIISKIPYSSNSNTVMVYQIPSDWNGGPTDYPPPPTTYITVEKPGTIPKTIFVTHSWCTPRHIQWMDKNHVQVEHYRINLQSLFPQQELKVEDCYLGGVGDVRQTPEYKKLLKQPYFHDD